MSMPSSFSAHWRLAPLLLGVLLSACAGHSPEAPQDPQIAIETAAQGGYQPAQEWSVAGWDADWSFDGQPLSVSWLAPVGASKAPLIVYLPGLGEDARAASQWRRAWARAGYAVLALQPTQYGRSVFSSSEAQAGVFRSLAQRSYADAALRSRVALARRAVAELHRRAEHGQADLAGIDWQRSVVAGFDLGAQTAAALVGEGGVAVAGAWQPQAAILLSPYVANDAQSTHFARMGAPVLIATGAHDDDPFSWVDSTKRPMLWQGLQVAGSYQLLLDQAPHRLFGGSLDQPPRGEGRERPLGGMPSGEPGTPPGGGEGRGHHRRPQSNAMAESRMGHGQSLDMRVEPKQVAALRVASLAFLDAQLREVPAARDWLNGAADTWLAPARLQRKP